MQKKLNNPIRIEWRWVKTVYLIVLGFCLLGMQSVYAQGFAGSARSDASTLEEMTEIKATKGKGWQLTTKGGLTYINPSNKDYWVGINGVLRLDEIIYSGDYQDRGFEFPGSCGRIRRLDVAMEGGLGKDWEYSVQIFFQGLFGRNLFGTANRNTNTLFGSAVLEDTFIGYTGLCKDCELFFGRLSGNWFGLEGATGGSWMAFLERSSQNIAFYPGDGIGVMFDKWWENGAITLLATQPDQKIRILSSNARGDITNFNSDRWRFLVRATFAPIHCLGDVWHFGISEVYRQATPFINGRSISDFSIAGLPGGVVPRNLALIRPLLATPNVLVSYSNQWAVEAARQIGPFIAEGEYSEMSVHQVQNTQGTLRFKGWNMQARYLLTGEAHHYDLRDGNFAKVEPCDPCLGAWEVAARYDFVNLNDKFVFGGSQHNVTLGLNWFYSDNIRTSFNYISCRLHPSNSEPLRKLNVFAFRIQVRFK